MRTLRLLPAIVAAMLSGLTGCASTPAKTEPAPGPQAAPAAAAPPAPASVAAAVAAAPTVTEEIAPAPDYPGWTRRQYKGKTVYCKSEPETGSRIPGERCLGENAMRELQKGASDDIEALREHAGYTGCSSTQPC